MSSLSTGENMPDLKLLVTGVALSAAITGIAMLPASSASAATPACTKRVLSASTARVSPTCR
jgi:hypothetical protein